MPLGRFWGTLFFLLMTFASFSTVTAVFENIVISVVDIFGIKREVSVVVNCLFLAVSSIPCVLGFNILKDVTFLGSRNVLDFEDYLVSNLILPTGALVMLLFCVTKFGWGFDNYIEEVNTGEGLKMPASLKYFYRIVLPVLIIIIIINGIKA